MFFNLVVLLVANFISHTVPTCLSDSKRLPACVGRSVRLHCGGRHPGGDGDSVAGWDSAGCGHYDDAGDC